jgi:hypothetical protein
LENVRQTPFGMILAQGVAGRMSFWFSSGEFRVAWIVDEGY